MSDNQGFVDLTTIKKKPSVFLTITQMEIGGAQKSAIGLAEHLELAGYPVELCFFYDKGGQIPELTKAVTFPVIDLQAKHPQGGKLSFVSALRGLVRMYRRLRLSRPQVFIGFTPYSNILGGLVSWIARVPVRIGSQRSPLWRFPWWLWRVDGFMVNRGILHHMIAVSEDVKRFCVEREGIEAKRVSVVQNGVDTSAFESLQMDRGASRARLGIEPDRLVILCIGRLVPPKGFDLAIRALSVVKEDIKDPLLLIVGEGPEAEVLRGLSYELGLDDCVRFEGLARDVRTHLSASDLFLLPSRWDGFPNALLEAMAAGVPVIGAEVGGVVEVIEHERCGLLVRPDDPEAMATAILRMGKDHGLRAALGAKGKERVSSKFNRGASFEKFMGVLSQVFDQPLAARR